MGYSQGTKSQPERLMETVRDALAHAQWLIEHGRGEEPCKLFLPKVEAQRRRENKEGYKRFVIQVDEELYKQFHAMKDRFITLCFNNPSLAYPVLLQILAAVDDQTIVSIAEAEQKEDAERT